MTLSEFLTACENTDALITIMKDNALLAKVTAASVAALDSTVKAQAVESFKVVSNKDVSVVLEASL